MYLADFKHRFKRELKSRIMFHCKKKTVKMTCCSFSPRNHKGFTLKTLAEKCQDMVQQNETYLAQ